MENTAVSPELQQIFFRLTVVENAQKESARVAADTNVQVQKELSRLDGGLEGVRQQAKAHNETNIKAHEGIRLQMEGDKKELVKMLTENVRELYTGIDKIVNALGLNESLEAAGNLRDNLKTLSDSINSRKEDVKWIRRGVITIVLSGIATIFVLGAKAYFGG